MKRLLGFKQFENSHSTTIWLFMIRDIAEEIAKEIGCEIKLKNDDIILQILNGKLIGTIQYWESGEDNPFYRNGEYPQYEWVIEVCAAWGDPNDEKTWDSDNIRLIPIADGNRKIEREELKKAMMTNLDDATGPVLSINKDYEK